MSSKIFAGLVAVGFSVFAVACAGGAHDDATDSSEGAATAAACADTSPTPCTPVPGTALRSGIADLLRFSISNDLSKNGVEPGDGDIKFVFKTLLIQQSHIYAAATIMKADGVTPYDMSGTKYAGRPNTVQSLMEVESGSEFTHQIGISLDQKSFACDFVAANFTGQAPGIYQGDMQADCARLGGSTSVDAACLEGFSQQSDACTDISHTAPALTSCLARVDGNLDTCCAAGGSSVCRNH